MVVRLGTAAGGGRAGPEAASGRRTDCTARAPSTRDQHFLQTERDRFWVKDVTRGWKPSCDHRGCGDRPILTCHRNSVWGQIGPPLGSTARPRPGRRASPSIYRLTNARACSGEPPDTLPPNPKPQAPSPEPRALTPHTPHPTPHTPHPTPHTPHPPPTLAPSTRPPYHPPPTTGVLAGDRRLRSYPSNLIRIMPAQGSRGELGLLARPPAFRSSCVHTLRRRAEGFARTVLAVLPVGRLRGGAGRRRRIAK